jgi:hypothetical protein
MRKMHLLAKVGDCQFAPHRPTQIPSMSRSALRTGRMWKIDTRVLSADGDSPPRPYSAGCGTTFFIPRRLLARPAIQRATT